MLQKTNVCGNNLNPTTASEVDRKPLITCELQELESVIGELECNLNRLYDKIKPILMPDCPSPNKEQKDPEPCLPEIGLIIRGRRQFLQHLSNVTRDITNRIEV